MRRRCSFPFIAEPRYISAQATIKPIGAGMAHCSFDLSFDFIIVTMMLFIYAVDVFTKVKVRARKRILLPAITQEVQKNPNLLPTQPHKIIATDYKPVAGRRYWSLNQQRTSTCPHHEVLGR